MGKELINKDTLLIGGLVVAGGYILYKLSKSSVFDGAGSLISGSGDFITGAGNLAGSTEQVAGDVFRTIGKSADVTADFINRNSDVIKSAISPIPTMLSTSEGRNFASTLITPIPSLISKYPKETFTAIAPLPMLAYETTKSAIANKSSSSSSSSSFGSILSSAIMPIPTMISNLFKKDSSSYSQAGVQQSTTKSAIEQKSSGSSSSVSSSGGSSSSRSSGSSKSVNQALINQGWKPLPIATTGMYAGVQRYTRK